MRVYANTKAMARTGCIVLVLIGFLTCVPFWFSTTNIRETVDQLTQVVNMEQIDTDKSSNEPASHKTDAKVQMTKVHIATKPGSVDKTNSRSSIKQNKTDVIIAEFGTKQDSVAEKKGEIVKDEDNRKEPSSDKSITSEEGTKKDNISAKIFKQENQKKDESSTKTLQSLDQKKEQSLPKVTQLEGRPSSKIIKSDEEKKQQPPTKGIQFDDQRKEQPSIKSVQSEIQNKEVPSAKMHQKEEQKATQISRQDDRTMEKNITKDILPVIKIKDVEIQKSASTIDNISDNRGNVLPVIKSNQAAPMKKTEEKVNSVGVDRLSEQRKETVAQIDHHKNTGVTKTSANAELPIQHPISVAKGSDRTRVEPVMIPEDTDLQKMDRDQLEELYHLYVENLQTHCVRQRHLGNLEYGGYHICEDVMGGQSCLMYSFGSKVQNERSFDYGVARQYGCEVHFFDPLYSVQKSEDKDQSNKVTCHPFELGPVDDPLQKTLTLNSIITTLKHTERRISILKMDIESREWDSLTQIAKGQELSTVKLLIVEFHVCDRNCSEGNQRTKEQYARYLSLFKQLYAIGFRIYFFKTWPSCNFKANGVTRIACHDVHMMK